MSEEKKISQKELRELKRLQKLEAEKERTEQLKVYEKNMQRLDMCAVLMKREEGR